MLDCAVRYEAGFPWLELRGRLDSLTAPQVQQHLSDLVARGERAVVVALQDVHYVSSAGLRVLLGTQKRLGAAGGELILFRLPDAVRSVFDLGGLLATFRQAATAEEVALLLRPPESQAAVVVRESHGATFHCLARQAAKGSLRAIGSPTPLARAQYGESDVVPVPATDLAGGVGLAALGEGFDEYRGLFGESVVIRHHLFTYPAIPNPTADYLLCTSPEPPPTYKFLHGFGFQGACAHLVAFDAPDGRLDLGRMTEALFTIASADVLGLLFVAESAGVWGMHLKRIPLAANAPANGGEIYDPENFPQWLHFPLEPEDAGHILAGAGLAVRDRRAVGPSIQALLPDGLPFHLHAGVFAREPLATKVEQFESELARVLNQLEPLKVYHLLGRTSFRNGLLGVIELDGIAMDLWVGAISLGLLYGLLTMGAFITFRVLDFPDITVDGSFTLGAAVTAVAIVSGLGPVAGLAGAFASGALAGALTAWMHTRLRINGLLAGILVMTALYSINLHLMGRANIPLLGQPTLFAALARLNPGLPAEVWIAVAAGVALLLFWLAIALFFATDLGLALRATGSNAVMAAAGGINVSRMRVSGVALANGFVAVSGGLVAQYQGFADVGMGIGTLVVGLAGVIMGEALLRGRSIYLRTLSVLLGAVIFRLLIAAALFAGMNPIDLKLLTAAFVLAILVLSQAVGGKDRARSAVHWLAPGRLGWMAACAGACLLLIVAGQRWWGGPTAPASRPFRIGLVQLVDNPLLNTTRDSFVAEMGRLGCGRQYNCSIALENAHGDLPTVNTIVDKFLQDRVDLVVSISTAATQVAVNKVKDRPVVFATVANPFLIGAGKSDTDHLPNVTGVYGWVPMEQTMRLVRRLLPGPIRVGAIWNPSQANSAFNVRQLQEAIRTHPDVAFVGATIAGSADVYQAALSLAQQKIDAFVLPPDNLVFSAFESVVKAAESRRIPIFISDVERLADGALGALGYDYTSSGVQAAHLVDRIRQGAAPKDLPFERYKVLTFGLNLRVARALEIRIPPDLQAEATMLVGDDPGGPARRKGTTP